MSCPICFKEAANGELKPPLLYTCSLHTVCDECYSTLDQQGHRTCPVCRKISPSMRTRATLVEAAIASRIPASPCGACSAPLYFHQHELHAYECPSALRDCPLYSYNECDRCDFTTMANHLQTHHAAVVCDGDASGPFYYTRWTERRDVNLVVTAAAHAPMYIHTYLRRGTALVVHACELAPRASGRRVQVTLHLRYLRTRDHVGVTHRTTDTVELPIVCYHDRDLPSATYELGDLAGVVHQPELCYLTLEMLSGQAE